MKWQKLKTFLMKKETLKNTKIRKRSHAYGGCAFTHNFGILNSFNPELQFKDNEFAVKNKLKDLLIELKEFKFVTTLVLELQKIECNDETTYSTFYSTSKAEVIINESDIDDVFELIYSIKNIHTNIQNSLGTGRS